MRSSLLRSVILCILLPAVISGCASTSPQEASEDELRGTLTVSGAWALYPLMIRWAQEFQSEHPLVMIDVSAGGAGKGMADALAGAADLGMVSREINPEEIKKGAKPFPVAKDAVFVTVNQTNPVLHELERKGLTREILTGIYITGEITTWGQVVGDPTIQNPVHVYTRSDAAGAPATFAAYIGYAQEDLLGIGVFGDPGLVEAVAQDPLAIGYNNLNYAFDPDTGDFVAGIRAVSLDGNGSGSIEFEELCNSKAEAVQAVANGYYPAPPARDLYLVAGSQPIGLVRTFLLWIMTDGQKYIDEVGYIPVSTEKLQQAIHSLEP